jgi:hypothetical protein
MQLTLAGEGTVGEKDSTTGKEAEICNSSSLCEIRVASHLLLFLLRPVCPESS